eukprot:SAG31_NODE_7157_length_1771_cov_2.869019_2_plen_226_part_00
MDAARARPITTGGIGVAEAMVARAAAAVQAARAECDAAEAELAAHRAAEERAQRRERELRLDRMLGETTAMPPDDDGHGSGSCTAEEHLRDVERTKRTLLESERFLSAARQTVVATELDQLRRGSAVARFASSQSCSDFSPRQQTVIDGLHAAVLRLALAVKHPHPCTECTAVTNYVVATGSFDHTVFLCPALVRLYCFPCVQRWTLENSMIDRRADSARNLCCW